MKLDTNGKLDTTGKPVHQAIKVKSIRVEAIRVKAIRVEAIKVEVVKGEVIKVDLARRTSQVGPIERSQLIQHALGNY